MQTIVRTIVAGIFILYTLPSSATEPSIGAELQWAFCGVTAEKVVSQLKLSPKKYKPRSVYYLETIDKTFLKNGLVMRVRVEDGIFKSALKSNYPSSSDIPWDLINVTTGECEYDIYPGFFKVGCSVKSDGKFDQTLGNRIFSQSQLYFLTQLELASVVSSIKTWGPLKGQEVKVKTASHSQDEIAIDEIIESDGLISTELSVKTSSADYSQVFAEWDKKVRLTSLPLCKEQTGRTTRILNKLIN